MSGIPESKKPRVTSGIDNMIDECSKWYHNTQEWYEDSWDSGVSCNEQIRNEMNKVDEAYELLQKQNQELIEALKFYADGLNYESVYEDDEMDLHIKIDREDVCFDEDDQYFGYAGDFARKTLAKFSKGEL